VRRRSRVTFLGVHLIGLTRKNPDEFLLRLAWVGGVLLAQTTAIRAPRLLIRSDRSDRAVFWTRHATALGMSRA
jgi:hypothetical protein